MKNDASKRARWLYARSFHAVTPIAVCLVSLLFAILLPLHLVAFLIIMCCALSSSFPTTCSV